MENTFPAALVERINGMSVPGVAAEFVQIGDVRMAEPCGYDVIVDRISHDIPFYRAWLKNCALCGTKIINNPFWWSADDKFFNYALATKLGVAIPPTALLPHKEHPTGTTERSMRNLHYPLDWDGDLPVRRLPRVPEAVRWRRLARRLQDQHPRGVLHRLRPDEDAVHDAAAGGELQGVLPLLRGRPGTGPHHALRSARAVPRALRAQSAGLPARVAGAGHARRAAAVPRPGLRPEHRRVRRRRRRAVRDRLHEPGARCRPAFGGSGQLRVDRRTRWRSWRSRRPPSRRRRPPIAGTRFSKAPREGVPYVPWQRDRADLRAQGAP